MQHKQRVKEIDFKLRRGQSLVVSLWPHMGIERVIITNKKGVCEVHADGHERFEFIKGKSEPGTCDFWLANPSRQVLLQDYLASRFYGQFAWGDLFAANDSKIRKAIGAEIGKIVDEFESKAANRLNRMFKKMKKTKSSKKGRGVARNKKVAM